MQKLKEIKPVPEGKVGWELEAWYRLKRAAESGSDIAMLTNNVGQSETLGWGDPANDEIGWEVQVMIDGKTVVDRRQLSLEEATAEFDRWIE